MATYQTYQRQFKKTFKIVDEQLSEYYDLIDQGKISGDDEIVCTYADLERYDSSDFKWLEKMDNKIFGNNETIKMYERFIEKLKEENKKIESQTRYMKETIKNGNGIDKDYCKYLLECEKEIEK